MIKETKKRERKLCWVDALTEWPRCLLAMSVVVWGIEESVLCQGLQESGGLEFEILIVCYKA